MKENTINLTIAELQEYLHISRTTAYNLAHSKGFPLLRVGRRVLVPKKNLDEWIEQNVKQGLESKANSDYCDFDVGQRGGNDKETKKNETIKRLVEEHRKLKYIIQCLHRNKGCEFMDEENNRHDLTCEFCEQSYSFGWGCVLFDALTPDEKEMIPTPNYCKPEWNLVEDEEIERIL